jgi:glucose/arabinose dehydrogenase
MAPSFVGPIWSHGFSDAELTHTIKEGVAAAGMPSFGSVLSEVQIRQVIAFIRVNALHGNVNAGPGPTPTSPDPLPTGVVRTALESFRVQKVAKLDKPFAIAFLPDGRGLITQTSGQLRILEKGRLLPEPVRDTPTGPPPQDPYLPRLLMNVEVDPDYRHNGWIYLSWATQAPGVEGAEGMEEMLSRGRLRDGHWVDNQTLAKILASNIGSARFALDGKGFVYLATGAGEFGDAPPGGIAPAQDVRSPMGKILRFRDDGGVPTDNPFVGQKDADPAVWSLGHRSVMGLTFDARGALWESEDGPRGGDELNLIKPGRNYGWPLITWGHRYDDRSVVPHPEGDEQPVVNWSPSPALGGIEYYGGAAFPRWKGSLFLGSLKYRTLYRLALSGDHVVLQETILYNNVRFRDIATAPDGTIYVVSDGGDILRLVPAR